jgi:hypothetical protein
MKPDEISRAVRNSAPGALKQRQRRQSWPRRNYDQIEAIGLRGIRLSELERRSPIQLAPSPANSETIIDALFPGDPLLCAGPSLNLSLTRSREAWRGFLERQQFIVPSSMSKTGD